MYFSFLLGVGASGEKKAAKPKPCVQNGFSGLRLWSGQTDGPQNKTQKTGNEKSLGTQLTPVPGVGDEHVDVRVQLAGARARKQVPGQQRVDEVRVVLVDQCKPAATNRTLNIFLASQQGGFLHSCSG